MESILFVGDCHRPYHDERAWQLVLKAGRALKPTHLVVQGDFADFYTVSAHSKDPRRADRLVWELDQVRSGLDQLDELGATQKRFIAGNHEDRLRRYLQEKAPELFNVIDVPSLFGLKARGWAYTDYKQDTRLGKLYITHDVGNAGRYAAYKALDVYNHSVVTGHSHRLSYIVEGNAVGEYRVSTSFGWLGDITQIDYMAMVNAKKNWALGFGVGYLNPATGLVYLQPVPIVVKGGRYSCVVNGKLFED